MLMLRMDLESFPALVCLLVQLSLHVIFSTQAKVDLYHMYSMAVTNQVPLHMHAQPHIQLGIL